VKKNAPFPLQQKSVEWKDGAISTITQVWLSYDMATRKKMGGVNKVANDIANKQK